MVLVENGSHDRSQFFSEKLERHLWDGTKANGLQRCHLSCWSEGWKRGTTGRADRVICGAKDAPARSRETHGSVWRLLASITSFSCSISLLRRCVVVVVVSESQELKSWKTQSPTAGGLESILMFQISRYWYFGFLLVSSTQLNGVENTGVVEMCSSPFSETLHMAVAPTAAENTTATAGGASRRLLHSRNESKQNIDKKFPTD